MELLTKFDVVEPAADGRSQVRVMSFAPRRAPLPDFTALLASIISWRVAPAAPIENDKTTAASAAMADFLMIMMLPELC